MTDDDIEPDGIVRTALQLLPIPAHADDFWTRLDLRLDADTVPAAPAAGGTRAGGADPTTDSHAAVAARPLHAVTLEPDSALAVVPGALRRTSNVVLVAVAAAAVVVVALAGNALLEERTADVGDATALVTPSDDLDALVDRAHPESSTPSTLSPRAEDASSAAVLAWVDDLRAGDSDDAWAAMGATSKAHFGSQAAFDSQLTSLAEGYGAWSGRDPDQVLITALGTDDDGTLAVVTLVGTVMVDGEEQHRADAFPVRVVDGKAHLEPFALAGQMEVVVPEDMTSEGVRPPVADGEELVIVVPAGVDAPVLRLDDGTSVVCGVAEGTELTDLADTPGQRCAYLPTEGIDPGEHTLTVAFLGSDGSSISAASLLFEAA